MEKNKSASIPIPSWPSSERPRERLLSQGAENLSTTELLAIIFSTGSQGKTALDLARELLKYQPDLRQLLTYDLKNLKQFSGLGAAKYCQLQASIELGKRYLQESLKRQGVVTQAKDAKEFLIARLRDLEQEVFACLFLDSQNHIIAFEKLFQGSINSIYVHIRVVVRRALHHNASALIVAHNHPSGMCEPSKADRHMTAKLQQALGLVEVKLLDHFVIGNPGVCSLAEEGFF